MSFEVHDSGGQGKTIMGMQRSRGTYRHDGENIAFIARPTMFYGVAAAVGLLTAQAALELLVRRYLRWAWWLARKNRGVVLGMISAVLFAGCGFEVLRIYDRVYIEREWFNLEDYVSTQEAGAPNPLRRGRRAMRFTNGRLVETDVDAATIAWAFRAERGFGGADGITA